MNITESPVFYRIYISTKCTKCMPRYFWTAFIRIFDENSTIGKLKLGHSNVSYDTR